MANELSEEPFPPVAGDCASEMELVAAETLKFNFASGASEEIINCLALMLIDHVVSQEKQNREEGESRGDV